MRLDHIRDIGLPGVVVMLTQPAIIAGIGGDAAESEFGLGRVKLVEQAMQGQDA